MISVLLVEDEATVADMIRRGLAGEGLSIETVGTGEEAIEILASVRFDILLLDVMLPGIDGFDVCAHLRGMGNPIPILMLTALAQVDDRVNGLRIGADDYLGKPFEFDELVARVQALVRRARRHEGPPVGSPVLRNGNLAFDTRTLLADADGLAVALTARERAIFRLLLLHGGQILTRDRISREVWRSEAKDGANIVDVYVGRLRRKLGAPGRRILTVRGLGYRLVTSQADDPLPAADDPGL